MSDVFLDVLPGLEYASAFISLFQCLPVFITIVTKRQKNIKIKWDSNLKWVQLILLNTCYIATHYV